MKIKKDIKQNLNSSIINFFKCVSTSPFESEQWRIESLYNHNFKIYKSNDYTKRLQKLAVLILNNDVKNVNELNYIIEIIESWLGKSLYDESLFTIKDVKKNLFENRSIEDIPYFCKKFEYEIKEIMIGNIKNRFFMIPVKNFFKDSFKLERIGYLSKYESISPIIYKCFSGDNDKVEFIINNVMNDKIFEKADGFIYVITNEGESFKDKSIEELKFFVTVFLALTNDNPSSIMCSISPPFEIAVFFDDFNIVYFENFKNPILPSILGAELISFNQQEIEKWFNTFKKLKIEDQEKIKRFVYLVNNAFCNKEYKKFNEICKSIDCLFGINRKVSKTINGNLENIVKKYDGDKLFFKKIDKLWSLRNKITHGEIKEITESKIYLDYQLEFISCPEKDYLDLSFFCIKHSVNYFKDGFYLNFENEEKGNKNLKIKKENNIFFKIRSFIKLILNKKY